MPALVRPLLATAALLAGGIRADAQPPAHWPITSRTAGLPLPLPDVPTVPPKPPGESRPLPPPAAFPAYPSPPPLNTVYAPPPAAAPPPVVDRSFALEPYWNDGLFLRSADRGFVAHLGGMLHSDAAFYSGGRGVQDFPGGVGRFADGVNPRRVRLLFDGDYYQSFDYRLEVEFMNGVGPIGSNSPVPGDAYLTVKRVPWVGNVRVGHQKEWFSLERLDSASGLPFLERSVLTDFSLPAGQNVGRSPGVSTFRTWANDSLFTAVGVYKNVAGSQGFGVGAGEYAITGRVAALPVWLPHAQTYWHVGGAMSHRDAAGDTVRLVARSGVRNAPFSLLNLVADTGAVPADSQTLFNLESAFASGPLTVSGEFTTSRLAHTPASTVAYHGFYTQATYFLTGEHRAWDPATATFRRVTPLRTFDPRCGSWGGWEVGGRFGHLDLDSRGVNGGRVSTATLGLTWYWSANVRLQVNYDYLYRDGGPNPLARGSVHSLGTRLALDF